MSNPVINISDDMMVGIERYRLFEFGMDKFLSVTKRELLIYAKFLEIKGRHDMTKDVLAKAIFETVQAIKNQVIEIEYAQEQQEKHNNDNNNNFEKKENNMKNNNMEYAVKIGSKSKRSQNDYINNIEVGMIIAFKISESRAISAMVNDVVKSADGDLKTVFCTTKNGMEYEVPRSSIVWVKTGQRWPRAIFDMLRGRTHRYFNTHDVSNVMIGSNSGFLESTILESTIEETTEDVTKEATRENTEGTAGGILNFNE